MAYGKICGYPGWWAAEPKVWYKNYYVVEVERHCETMDFIKDWLIVLSLMRIEAACTRGKKDMQAESWKLTRAFLAEEYYKRLEK